MSGGENRRRTGTNRNLVFVIRNKPVQNLQSKPLFQPHLHEFLGFLIAVIKYYYSFYIYPRFLTAVQLANIIISNNLHVQFKMNPCICQMLRKCTLFVRSHSRESYCDALCDSLLHLSKRGQNLMFSLYQMENRVNPVL